MNFNGRPNLSRVLVALCLVIAGTSTFWLVSILSPVDDLETDRPVLSPEREARIREADPVYQQAQAEAKAASEAESLALRVQAAWREVQLDAETEQLVASMSRSRPRTSLPFSSDRPVDRDLQVKRREWFRSTYLNWWQRSGSHSPDWDEKARAFLEDVCDAWSRGIVRCDYVVRPADSKRRQSELWQAAQELVELKCDDLLIQALIAELAMNLDQGSDGFLTESLSLRFAERYETAEFPAALRQDVGMIWHRAFPYAESEIPDVDELLINVVGAGVESDIERMILFNRCRQSLYQQSGHSLKILKLFSAEDADPWLRAQILGTLCVVTAGSPRMTEWFSQRVEAEGADQTSVWLKTQAYRWFVTAWRINSAIPISAASIIPLETPRRMSDVVTDRIPEDLPNITEDMRFWFDQAVAAQFDFQPVYRDYIKYLAAPLEFSLETPPFDDAVVQRVIAFARECAETDRFDTYVPFQCHRAIHNVEQYRYFPGFSQIPVREGVMARKREVFSWPETNDLARHVYAGYQEYFERAGRSSSRQAALAGLAFLSGHDDEARSMAAGLPSGETAKTLQGMGLELQMLDEVLFPGRQRHGIHSAQHCRVVVLDSQRVVTAGDDGSVRVWNAATSRVDRQLEGSTARILSLARSHDGAVIAWGDIDGRIEVRGTGSEFSHVATIDSQFPVASMAVDRKGERVVAASEASATEEVQLAVIDFAQPDQRMSLSTDGISEIGRIVVESTSRLVLAACLATDGRMSDWSIGAWNLETGERRDMPLRFADDISFDVLPSGESLVAFGYPLRNGTASEWPELVRLNLADGTEIESVSLPHRDAGDVRSIPGQNLVLTSTGDRTLQVRSVAGLQSTEVLMGHLSDDATVATAPDGSLLATLGERGELEFWWNRSGHWQSPVSVSIQDYQKMENQRFFDRRFHKNPVARWIGILDQQLGLFGWTPDDAYTAGRPVGEPVGLIGDRIPSPVALTSNGRLAVIAGPRDEERRNHRISIVDPATGDRLHRLTTPNHQAVGLSADGALLAMSPLYDRHVATGAFVDVYACGKGEKLARGVISCVDVNSIAFSPDGSLLLAGGLKTGVPDSQDSGVLRVWSVENLLEDASEILTVVYGVDDLTDGLQTVAFSPDGTLAFGAGGGTTTVWKTSDWTVAATLQGAEADWSSNGRWIITGGGPSLEREARVFRTDTFAEVAVLRLEEEPTAGADSNAPSGQTPQASVGDQSSETQSDQIIAVAFSPDDRLVFARTVPDWPLKVAGNRVVPALTAITCWDRKTGQQVSNLTPYGRSQE